MVVRVKCIGSVTRHVIPHEVALEGRDCSWLGRAGWALLAELSVGVVAPHVNVAAAGDACSMVFTKAERSEAAGVTELMGLAAAGPVADAKLRRRVAAWVGGTLVVV